LPEPVSPARKYGEYWTMFTAVSSDPSLPPERGTGVVGDHELEIIEGLHKERL
jgi:hypothetical protein